ncbi:ABC transporter ATP-binding protein [Roseovarius aestuariivivens]|uniref:ABC transporter ATP-binding protein n=1 Tax=Roseovarius aestuariivivens TaxID=1888910 RepID=UPI0010812219|nr:ATP-binding cassette domain-containing protein [Roseovarius aestuariivivens]
MSQITFQGDLRLGARALISGLDVTIPTQGWTALLGASGLGKTSLARLIAGLPTPARLDGFIPPDPMTIGLMSQDGQLLPWATALDNVTIGARLAGKPPDPARARELLSRVGLAGRENTRPAALSAGQRQRVALARVLYDDRAIIVLDEPFSALDVLTRQRMQDLAAKLLKGRTVILITHDPAEAVRLAERAYVLHERGATPVALPPEIPPRDATNPETLTAQAALLQRLASASEASIPA